MDVGRDEGGVVADGSSGRDGSRGCDGSFPGEDGLQIRAGCFGSGGFDSGKFGGVAVERNAGTDEIFCAGFGGDDVVQSMLLGEKSGGISGVNPLRMKSGSEDLVDRVSKPSALELVLLGIEHVGGGEMSIDAGEAQGG